MTFEPVREIPDGVANVYDPETGCMFVFRRKFPTKWDDLGYGIPCDIFSLAHRKWVETALLPATGLIWNIWNSAIVGGKVTTLIGRQVYTYSYQHTRWDRAEYCESVDLMHSHFVAIHELGTGVLIVFESGKPMRYTRRENPAKTAWTVVPIKFDHVFNQCIKVM